MKAGAQGTGDVYTWTALDADTKLMMTWLVGPRSHRSARVFMGDLASRVTGRPQITTDGFAGYLDAVDQAFGVRSDYAMLIKIYAGNVGTVADTKYSPPVCIGAEKVPQWGDPGPRPRFDVVCRAGEPDDADGDAAVYAPDQWFLTEGREPRACGGPPLHAL